MPRAADEEEARRRLIDAGVRLVRRHYNAEEAGGWTHALAWLHPAVVAEAAGYRSRGMIYRIWGGAAEDGPGAFERYLEDVMEYFLRSVADVEDLSVEALRYSLTGVDLGEWVAGAAGVEWDNMTSTERYADWAVMAATLFSSRGGAAWPDFVDCYERNLDRLEALYRGLGAAIGFRPIPGLEWRDVAIAIMSVYDGMLLNRLVVPEEFERVRPSPFPGDGPGTELRLIQIAVRAVFTSLVEPVPEGDAVDEPGVPAEVTA